MSSEINYRTLSDTDLAAYATKLGLDPVGVRTALLDRVSRHLKAQGGAAGKAANGDGGKGKQRRKTKAKKNFVFPTEKPEDRTADAAASAARKDNSNAPNVEIEYVVAPIEEVAPEFADYARVFAKFVAVEPTDEAAEEADAAAAPVEDAPKAKADDDDSDNSSDDGGDEEGKMSRKKMRKASRLTVAELKQLVRKPEVVDWVDVTGADPKLLVHLKSYRNSVPVPVHWSQKRKYLQGKRGIEKAPFELPDFIKATGIMEMRNAVKEKEDASKLKSKTRERHQPKMGKLDIDYQKLHDAFFRWQTKPKFTIHGDVYYEGKEFETKLKAKKPGQLSDDLKIALNMPPLAPPPWLINMQRYGPPPSYPALKVAGLNAPIPEGAQWGYHPGGWGKPPVDEYGRPLYGDVFGTLEQEVQPEHVAPIERTPWGELEPEEEEEVVEESSEEEEEDDAIDVDDGATDGLVTPSGISSVPSGLETPDHIELRKDARRDDAPKQLYTVVPERQTSVKGFMGSQHTYDLSGAPPVVTLDAPAPNKGTKRKADGSGVDVALNPEDLEEGLDDATIRKKYEQQLHVGKAPVEDFSDMVADQASKQAKKRAKKDDKKEKDKPKYKF
ncbi:Splicing factor 3B subunit 2 [Thoreauomyces humboldtii]|nr:Splicing factor 3B subunit 2 [Thoreauomyces humboldtii]